MTSAEGFDSSLAGERAEDEPTSLSAESDNDEKPDNDNDVSVDIDAVCTQKPETTQTTLEAEAARFVDLFSGVTS